MTYFMLNKLLYCEINAIGLIFTGIILKKSIPIAGFKTSTKLQRVFIYMLGTMMAIFLLDGVTWVMDGVLFRGSDILYKVCLTIYFMINPIIGFLWTIYVNIRLHNEIHHKQSKKSMVIYTVPVIVNVVLCIASPFTEWIFGIDEKGHYFRGNLYIFNLILSFIYFVISGIVIFRQMLKSERVRNNKDFKYLAFFPITPLAGMLIQSWCYGLSVVYISVLISFFIIFINVQNEQIYTDVATGLRNKRYLSLDLSERIVNAKRDSILGVILIDIDYFKILNDTYGHTIGDMALNDVAEILKRSLDENVDCISRFGGDEFVISLTRNTEKDICKGIENIKKHLDKFNNSGKRNYKLSFSIGYAVCRVGDSDMDIDGLLKQADIKMYEDKKNNHDRSNGKRRSDLQR